MPNWLNPFDTLDWATNKVFPDPSKKAMGPLNEIPGTIKPYFDPYLKGGEWGMGEAQKQYGQMMQDPSEIIQRLGAGYQRSPGYDWQMKQGQEAINNASAAGGMAGTPQHQQQAGQLASNLANQDYQQYLNQALGMFGMGTQGAMGMGQMGQQSATDLASALAQQLMNKSNLQYAGQASQNQLKGDLMSDIFGAFMGKK